MAVGVVVGKDGKAVSVGKTGVTLVEPVEVVGVLAAAGAGGVTPPPTGTTQAARNTNKTNQEKHLYAFIITSLLAEARGR